MLARQVLIASALKRCESTIATVAPVAIDPTMWPLFIFKDPGFILFKESHSGPNISGEYQSMPMSIWRATLIIRAVGLIERNGMVSIGVSKTKNGVIGTISLGQKTL